jgi:dTDP-4-amino-4,6-dideoxygalactose transaminase
VFGAPDIGDAEIDAVVAVMRSRWLGTGPRAKAFEGAFASYKGIPESRVAAVNSCTAALHLSLLGAGVGPGDEVIAPAMTFCATANAIIHAGATPVLADIDSTTLNLDAQSVERRVTSKTRAILPVHFAGRPCDMDLLLDLARRRGLKVVEDCAHAVESEYHGRKVGTLGDFGCFSFYVTKNLTTVEGGMVVSADPSGLERVRVLALHGLSHDAWQRFGDAGYKHYYVTEAGFKYNMTDMQAAIGECQLRKVESNWTRRQAIWRRYQAAFADLPVGLPAEPEPDTRHAYHLYTLQIDANASGLSRDAFLDAITAKGVGVGVHYLSLPEHPYYQRTYGWDVSDYPVAAAVGRRTVSLPLSPSLTDGDVGHVIQSVRGVLGGA